jgi:hypothetical protein
MIAQKLFSRLYNGFDGEGGTGAAPLEFSDGVGSH